MPYHELQNFACAAVSVAWVFWHRTHVETILATVAIQICDVILLLSTLVASLTNIIYGYFYVLSKCFKTGIMFTSITPQAQYQLLTKIAPIYVKILTSLHCANYHIHQHENCIIWISVYNANSLLHCVKSNDREDNWIKGIERKLKTIRCYKRTSTLYFCLEE